MNSPIRKRTPALTGNVRATGAAGAAALPREGSQGTHGAPAAHGQGWQRRIWAPGHGRGYTGTSAGAEGSQVLSAEDEEEVFQGKDRNGTLEVLQDQPGPRSWLHTPLRLPLIPNPLNQTSFTSLKQNCHKFYFDITWILFLKLSFH